MSVDLPSGKIIDFKTQLNLQLFQCEAAHNLKLFVKIEVRKRVTTHETLKTCFEQNWQRWASKPVAHKASVISVSYKTVRKWTYVPTGNIDSIPKFLCYTTFTFLRMTELMWKIRVFPFVDCNLKIKCLLPAHRNIYSSAFEIFEELPSIYGSLSMEKTWVLIRFGARKVIHQLLTVFCNQRMKDHPYFVRCFRKPPVRFFKFLCSLYVYAACQYLRIIKSKNGS